MDLSALIFVALAVAWAVYLIPKALKHHDEVVRSRSVEKFSHTMRVLARREPVDRRNARLVVAPIRAAPAAAGRDQGTRAPEPVAAAAPASRVAPRAPRRPASSAPLRAGPPSVVAPCSPLVLLANAVVIGLSVASVIAWPWVAAPVAVLVAWLVACRVSVRAEHRQRASWSAIEIGDPPTSSPTSTTSTSPARSRSSPPAGPLPRRTSPRTCRPPRRLPSPPARSPSSSAAGRWCPPPCRPTSTSRPPSDVRSPTIDLDSTGVWSSGHHDEDSALARSAEQSAKTAREAEEGRRASGA